MVTSQWCFNVNYSLIISICSFLFGSGLIANLWQFVSKKQKEQDDKLNAIAYGVQASLRDRLLQSYKHAVKVGCMSYDEKETWLNMYANYHNLGKNGVMDTIKDKIMELPLMNEE